MKKQTIKKSKSRPVLVTTEHRGVFFGYADKIDGEILHLKRMRNCSYWSSDMKGFLGLASMGPSPSCRIGPAVNASLRNITGVFEVTPEAVLKWESAPWG